MTQSAVRACCCVEKRDADAGISPCQSASCSYVAPRALHLRRSSCFGVCLCGLFSFPRLDFPYFNFFSPSCLEDDGLSAQKFGLLLRKPFNSSQSFAAVADSEQLASRQQQLLAQRPHQTRPPGRNLCPQRERVLFEIAERDVRYAILHISLSAASKMTLFRTLFRLFLLFVFKPQTRNVIITTAPKRPTCPSGSH